MKLNNKGYLLLETLLAMTVILTGILMLVSSINFLLLDEKKSQEELEMSIMLYEMASGLNLSDSRRAMILEKSLDEGFNIVNWEQGHLRIESEGLFLDVIRD